MPVMTREKPRTEEEIATELEGLKKRQAEVKAEIESLESRLYSVSSTDMDSAMSEISGVSDRLIAARAVAVNLDPVIASKGKELAAVRAQRGEREMAAARAAQKDCAVRAVESLREALAHMQDADAIVSAIVASAALAHPERPTGVAHSQSKNIAAVTKVLESLAWAEG